MERIVAWVAAALLALAAGGSGAAAQTLGQTPPPVVTLPADQSPDITEAALALGSAQTRMTVPVSIAARGPWGFVIDTGAERTVVSRQLAAVLGLAAGPPLRVIAMTGPSETPSVLVAGLRLSTLAQPTIVAPALEAQDIGAPGLLGIDALQGHRVDIDFDHAAMTVHPSRKRRVDAGRSGDEIVVVAKSLYGQLIVTDARWRGHRIAVVIDTGSAMTVGNPALLATMGAHAKALGPVSSTSVTGATLYAAGYTVDDLAIGGFGLSNVPVAIADAAPFRRFGLEKRPALMLGMDALRLFSRVRIDFANRAIEFVLPRTLVRATVAVQRS